MISRIYAEVLEELKKLGGILSQEQEIALQEVYREEFKVKIHGRKGQFNYY
jgi:hypothetical protein